MKLLAILLFVISVPAWTQEDCVFDETAYTNFISQYGAKHRNSKIKSDGKTLLVNRNNEEIVVTGGGCIHMGVAIELTSKQAYTEQQFLQKTQALALEFGGWLINIGKLKESIAKGKYQVIKGIYFIEVDAMTVFEVSYDRQGKISIDFYIN